jgi:hypothetical protein
MTSVVPLSPSTLTALQRLRVAFGIGSEFFSSLLELLHARNHISLLAFAKARKLLKPRRWMLCPRILLLGRLLWGRKALLLGDMKKLRIRTGRDCRLWVNQVRLGPCFEHFDLVEERTLCRRL